MADGSAVKVGTIGREGFVGAEILIGGAHWTETVACQIEGDALRMDIGDFRAESLGTDAVRALAAQASGEAAAAHAADGMAFDGEHCDRKNRDAAGAAFAACLNRCTVRTRGGMPAAWPGFSAARLRYPCA